MAGRVLSMDVFVGPRLPTVRKRVNMYFKLWCVHRNPRIMDGLPPGRDAFPLSNGRLNAPPTLSFNIDATSPISSGFYLLQVAPGRTTAPPFSAAGQMLPRV